jgi:hypothetical protein
MARQHTTSQSRISIARVALVAFALVILVGKLDGPAARLMTDLLGAAARTTQEILVPAAWQALQAYAFDNQWFSQCPLHMLVSVWPLLHVIAGAA